MLRDVVAAEPTRGHDFEGQTEILPWVRVEADEIDLILSLIPTGPLAEKLRREPDPQAAAFIAAVDTDDEHEVDADAVVSRGEDDGALFMSWIWVPASRWYLLGREEDDEIVFRM